MAFSKHLLSLAVARNLSYLRKGHSESESGLGGQLGRAGPLGMVL